LSASILRLSPFLLDVPQVLSQVRMFVEHENVVMGHSDPGNRCIFGFAKPMALNVMLLGGTAFQPTVRRSRRQGGEILRQRSVTEAPEGEV